MPPHTKDIEREEFCESIIAFGFDGVQEALALLINRSMLLKRERHLSAGFMNELLIALYQCFKPKSVQRRVGKLDISLPQTRE